MNILSKLFRREHKHEFKTVDFVYHDSKVNSLSVSACTAKVYRCKCGAERREMTDAGYQQWGWGDDPEEISGVKNVR